jgi:tRNA(adenine34) deaminase
MRLVDGVWRDCFELAWEAFRAGTIPVGAIVVEHGEVIARGRNRIMDKEAPPRQLADTFLAHAEINALAQLEPRRYPDATLYTTLEPCLLCTGGAVMTGMGVVRYAAPDPFGGSAALRVDNAVMRLGRTRIEGPEDGLLAQLGELLHLAFFLRANPEGAVLTAYRDLNPAQVAVAEALALHEVETLDDVIARASG